MNAKTLIWLAVTLASMFAPKLGLHEIDDGTKGQLIDGAALVVGAIGAIFAAKSPALTDKAPSAPAASAPAPARSPSVAAIMEDDAHA